MRLVLTILSAAVLAAPAALTAQTAPGAEAPRRMMTLPATRAEAQERARARFLRMDRNGDGVVTADEMPVRGSGGGAIARLDGDGDGKLSAAEFEARALALFDRQDTDHDGRLSDDERSAWRDRMGAAQPGGD
jgi:hypothetical protein